MRRGSAAFLAALLAGCGGGGGAAPVAEPDELAAACIEALGGREALEGLEVVHTLDSLYMAGLGGTSESWWRREPFAGRVTVRIGPVEQDLLMEGDSVWSVDRNGSLTPGDETARAQAALAERTVFHAFLLEGDFSTGPDSTVDGAAVHRLDFDAGGTPVTWFVSAETHLPVLMRTEVMGMEVLSRPGGWTRVCGVAFPGRTGDSIPALGQATRTVAILAECNVAVPDTVFMLEAGPGDAVLAAPGTPHPFRLDDGHVYVPGVVCGTPVEMLLDTGAGATVIDSGLASRLGLAPAGGFSAVGVAGSSTAGFVEVPAYSALGATVTGQVLPELPLDEPFHPVTGHHVGMVLGYDFLSRFVTLIDYGDRTITLHDPSAFSYDGPGAVLPATRAMSLLAVDAVVEDSLPALLLLDTGAGGALHVTPTFLERHPGFLEGRPTGSDSVHGVGGGAELTVFETSTVTLGGFTVPAGPSTVLGDVPALSWFDGVVGSSVLSGFRVWLDYRTPRVILEPLSGEVVVSGGDDPDGDPSRDHPEPRMTRGPADG